MKLHRYINPRIGIKVKFIKTEEFRRKVDNRKATEKKDTEVAIRIGGEGRLVNV